MGINAREIGEIGARALCPLFDSHQWTTHVPLMEGLVASRDLECKEKGGFGTTYYRTQMTRVIELEQVRWTEAFRSQKVDTRLWQKTEQH